MVVCPVGMKLFNRADCFFFLFFFFSICTYMVYSCLDVLWSCSVCLVAQCSHDGAHLDRWTQCNQIPFCFWACLSSHTFMNALYMCTLMSCLIKPEPLNIKGLCAW